MEFLDNPYHSHSKRDPCREFDLYLPSSQSHHNPPPLVIFIHGGAWRDEDKADHKLLARSLAASTRFPIAVINYRLTPRDPPDDNHFCHPGHAEDTLQALTFLASWQGPTGIGRVYDAKSFYLIGHSCGAHMLTSIFLDSSSLSPSLTPPVALGRAIKGIAMSEGIYDLDLLLASFPEYHSFVAHAFAPHQSYSSFATTNFPLLNRDISWLIIHSRGDSLIDLPQSTAIYKHLRSLYGGDAGARVHFNSEELTGEHDDILRTEKYISIIKDFILTVKGRE